MYNFSKFVALYPGFSSLAVIIDYDFNFPVWLVSY